MFWIQHPGQAIERARTICAVVWTGLGLIAATALLAGSLSAMGVMLASVLARRREIGIRMAVGAERRDVQRQFLGEAVIVGVAGGLFGVLAGVCIHYGLRLADIPSDLSVGIAAAAFAVAVLSGVMFGIAPAGRAARLNLEEALAVE